MSIAARRLPSQGLAATGLLLIAVVVGAIAGHDPRFGVAAAVGIAFALIAVVNLAAGLAVFGALTFLELAPVAGGVFSLAKVAGLVIAVSWIASAANEGGRARTFFTERPVLTFLLIALIAWTAISGIWAEASSETWRAVSRYGLDIALFPIVFTAIRLPKHLYWTAAGIVAGAGIAAAYGLISSPSASGAATSVTAAGDLNRITGTVGDPNLLASVLIVGMVVAIALALDVQRSPPMRLLFAGSAVLSLAAVFATVSRGGMVALGAALLASVAVAGPRRGRMAVAVCLVAVTAVGYFALFASAAQIDRLETSDGGSGRTDIWKVGWRMVEANPVHGVGGGNFSVSSVHYLLVDPGAIPRSDFIVDTPAVAHNLYLEVLAELGIVGLALFLGVAGASLWCSVRAASMFDSGGWDGLSLIARAVAIALISTAAADFFLAAEYSKLLWLLLALGPAMLALAQRLQLAAEQEQAGPSHRRGTTSAARAPSPQAAPRKDPAGSPPSPRG